MQSQTQTHEWGLRGETVPIENYDAPMEPVNWYMYPEWVEWEDGDED